MWVVINGERRQIPMLRTIGELLEHLGFAGMRVAVEQNGRVVKSAHLQETTLAEGDVLEIVRFVGGGEKKGEKE